MNPSPATPIGSSAPLPAGKRKWLRMAVYLIIALVLWAAFVWFAQRAVMFPRHAIPVPDAPMAPRDAEIWELDTDAGIVEAWFLPAERIAAENGDAHDDQPAPAVIFAHGNGEIIDFWPEQLHRYRQMGVSVLLPEYRGYGRSAGRPSQKAITRDFIAFRDRLAEHPAVDPRRIVYHGRSIGAGAMAALAEHRPPAAFISQSAFTSAADMARRMLVPRILMRDPFDVRSVLERYQGPVLILHGADDRIIPATHAGRLHDASPHGKLVIYEDTGHNEPFPHQQYWNDIQRFLDEAGIIPPHAADPPQDAADDARPLSQP